MPKLLFFDIDGTLCEMGQPVTPAVAEALRRAKSNGHKIFIATGRNIPCIPPSVWNIGFDGVMASAGCYVKAEGTVLRDDPMPEALRERCLRVFQAHHISYMLETAETSYADAEEYLSAWQGKLTNANSELRRTMMQLLEGIGRTPLKEYQGQPVYKICFIGRSEESVLAAMEELGPDFNRIVQDNADPAQPRVNGEVMAMGGDKGLALREICAFYGADTADAIAFGDSANDLPMLAAAGTSVCMGNAAKSVQEKADRICESCAEDGVARELERLGLA